MYDHGVRVSNPLFAAFLLPRPAGEAKGGARLGVTVPRAVGGAVERNRIKRRLREAFRLARAGFGEFDIVLNPRRSVLAASFADIQKALAKVMERTQL